jgi:hypothetical protein
VSGVFEVIDNNDSIIWLWLACLLLLAIYRPPRLRQTKGDER